MKREHSKQQRFAERLRERREALGLSQTQLAEAADLSPAGLSRLVNGERDWLPEHIIALARALKKTPLELIASTELADVLSDWVTREEYEKTERERLITQQENEALRSELEQARADLVITHTKLVAAERAAAEVPMLRDGYNAWQQATINVTAQRDEACARLQALETHWAACKEECAALRVALGNANRQATIAQQEAARSDARAGVITAIGAIAALTALSDGKPRRR